LNKIKKDKISQRNENQPEIDTNEIKNEKPAIVKVSASHDV